MSAPFVAIDFETADQQRDSACQIGLCRVEGGAVVYRDAVFVRPPRRSFHPMCVAVHGITWPKVEHADPWAVAWPKVLPVLKGAARLVAHNASFDRSVVNACCKAAGLAPPAIPWDCTIERARAIWPKPHSNKLTEVCKRLKVPVLAHHDAGDDAEMCARVLLALEAGGGADARTEDAPPPPEAASGPLAEVRRLAGPAADTLIELAAGGVIRPDDLLAWVTQWRADLPALRVLTCRSCGRRCESWLQATCRACVAAEPGAAVGVSVRRRKKK